MRLYDFIKPLVDIKGYSDINVDLELFEQYHYKQAGVLSENTHVMSAEIEYIKKLLHYSSDPRIGAAFVPVCVALLSTGLKIYGVPVNEPIELVAIETQGNTTFYKFSNGAKLPDSRLSNASYYQTFLFSDSVNYDKFRSAMALKFGQSLPDAKFNSVLSESISREEIYNFTDMFEKFLPVAMHYIGLESLPKMKFEPFVSGGSQPTFGKYENGVHILTVALMNRHPNDILRTVAHELVHYKQDLDNELNDASGETGSPEENQAHIKAGIVMRHFNKSYPQYLKSLPITDN